MCEAMVADGEKHLLYAELSESNRLKQLYEERLQHLLDRNPALFLISEGCDQMYDHYEQHFRYKIEIFYKHDRSRNHHACSVAVATGAANPIRRLSANHEGGVAFVRDIFRSMVGIVEASVQRRPKHSTSKFKRDAKGRSSMPV